LICLYCSHYDGYHETNNAVASINFISNSTSSTTIKYKTPREEIINNLCPKKQTTSTTLSTPNIETMENTTMLDPSSQNGETNPGILDISYI